MKWLGDGVMFYFEDPGNGVLAALDMVEGAATHGTSAGPGRDSTPARSSSRRVTTTAGP